MGRACDYYFWQDDTLGYTRKQLYDDLDGVGRCVRTVRTCQRQTREMIVRTMRIVL